MKRDHTSTTLTAATTALALGAGAAANAELFLLDLGQTSALSSGPGPTGSPDAMASFPFATVADGNGNLWNNFNPGIFTRLQDTDGNLTGAADGLGISFFATTGNSVNGSLTPGGPEAPDAALGVLAVASATQDYVFTQSTMSFTIGNLDENLLYSITLFGARATGSDRITEYEIGDSAQTLNTSTNTATTIVFSDLAADANGQIILDVSVVSGGFAYLNALSIESRPVPAPGAAAAVLGLGGLAARRRR